MSQSLKPKIPTISSLKSFLNYKEVRAFLDVISYTEGAQYDTLYGGSTFTGNYHPNKRITKWGNTSTAAGRYQFLFKTWNEVQQILNLEDFSPKNQDIAAVYLIYKRGAIPDILSGRLTEACEKLSYEWASLPPARYGQGVKTIQDITNRFKTYLKKYSNYSDLCILITIAAIPFLIFSK